MSTATSGKVVPFESELNKHAIMVRLPGTLAQRLSDASRATLIPRAALIRTAIIDKLDQLDARAASVTPIVAAQLREASRLGLNVERVLADAIGRQSRAAKPDPFPHRD